MGFPIFFPFIFSIIKEGNDPINETNDSEIFYLAMSTHRNFIFPLLPIKKSDENPLKINVFFLI